jgi:3-phosphoshikimate 1-carboxyvinyltransferase
VTVQDSHPGDGALGQDPKPVEGDWSAASFWIWRHAVIPLCQRLELKILTGDSHQADSVILDLLAKLAPQVSAVFRPETCTWTFVSLGSGAMPTNNTEERPSDLGQTVVNCDQGLWRIKATDFPDMVPALAMWAILSGNAVEFVGIGQLRYKESDRIQALMVNLELLGVPIEKHGPDGLLIRPLASWAVYSRRFVATHLSKDYSVDPAPLLRCFGDHRLAMALSMLALPDLPILLDEPYTVRKSYPGFWEDWAKFGYALKALN